MGAYLSQQRPSVPRALAAERRRSPAPGFARRAPGAGGREDLGWEEGKRRASLASLHHFQSKLRNKEGRAWARGGQTPGRGHRGRRGCSESSWGAWSSRESLRRCSGGLSGAAGSASVPGGDLGCQALAGRRPELRSVCPRGSRGSESTVRGPEVPAGDVPWGAGPFSSYKSGFPRPRRQLPGGSRTTRLSASRLSGLQGGPPPGSRCPRALSVRRWAAAARQALLPRSRLRSGAHTTSAQAELVVRVSGCPVLLEPWGSHQSPFPWSSSSGPGRGWSWSPDPTPTRPWCQPGRLGQRRRALGPRIPIWALATQHPGSEEKEGP